jgi:RHH-type transcriptional regulator, rel operon repressor / antitoxin RelB
MPTSIRLDATTEQRLDKLALETGRSKAFYLREIIARGIEDMEDIYGAAAVLERVRKGEEKTYSLDQVSAELGLDN